MNAERLENLAKDLRTLSAGGFDARKTSFVEIQHWRMATRPVLTICGMALDHPALGRKPIQTSEVYYLDLQLGIARTLSRWYRLGVPFEMPPSTFHQ
jgi:hypothetical protein